LRINALDDSVPLTLLTDTAASIPHGTVLDAVLDVTVTPNVDPILVNNTDITETVTFSAVGDLVLNVGHLADPVAGTTIGYQLSLTNSGPSNVPATALNPVTTVFTLPAGLTFNSFDGPGWNCTSIDGLTVTCDYTNTVVVLNEPVSVTVYADAAPNLVGVTLSPVASITASPTTDPVGDNHTAISDPSTFVGVADLVLTVGHTSAVSGAEVPYQLSVFNAGPSDLSASEGNPVTTRFTLPDGVSFVSFDGPGWSCFSADGQIVTCEFWGSIDAYSDPISVSVVTQSASSIPFGATLTVTASIMTSPLPDPVGGNHLGIDEPTTFTVSTDLQLTIGHLDPVLAGTPATMQLSVYNAGPSDSPATLGHPVTATLTLPAGVTYTNFDGPGWDCASADGHVVNCTFTSTIVAGQEPMSVMVWGDTATSIPTSAVLNLVASITTAPTPDPLPENHVGIVDPMVFGTETDLVLTTAHVDPVVAGAPVIYQLTVFNAGPSVSAATVATPITVQATLPAGATYASFDGVNWDCSSADGTLVTCDYTVAIGAFDDPVSVMITANTGSAIPAGTSVDLTASITAQPSADLNVANHNGIVESVVFTTAADVELSVSMLSPTVVSGSETQVQLSLTNSGPSNVPASVATPTEVVATLPAGTTFASATGAGWTCTSTDGLVVICDYTDTLSVNAEPASVMLTVWTAASIPAGTLNVVASVTAVSVVDPNPANDQAVTLPVAFTNQADLQLGIAHIDVADPGATVMYQVSVFNGGPSDAVPTEFSPITLELLLPASMTFDGFDAPGWECTSLNGRLVTCTSLERIGAFFDPAIINIWAVVSASATIGTAADVTVSLTALPTADLLAENNTVVDLTVIGF
jgi:hypothetical protein